MFTLGNWVFFIILLLLGIIGSIFTGMDYGKVSLAVISGIISVIISVILIGATMVAIGWYNTNTASGQRAVKDFKTNINNGLNREITITAEDGREIFHYEGKVDIESNHTDNYIKFDNEEGNGILYITEYKIQSKLSRNKGVK